MLKNKFLSLIFYFYGLKMLKNKVKILIFSRSKKIALLILQHSTSAMFYFVFRYRNIQNTSIKINDHEVRK